MSLFEAGRMVVKIAGRDAGRKAVVVDVFDNIYVLIDGNVRRKKVNIKHLEPLEQVIKLKPGASHEEVRKEFEKLELEVWNKKPKEAKERPKKVKKVKRRKEEPVKKVKKEVKEEVRKEEKPIEEIVEKENSPEK